MSLTMWLFALKLKKVPKKEIEERVEEALKMVQLNGYQKRSIQKLSGGQRQRVAIARAIINQHVWSFWMSPCQHWI